MSVHRQYTSNEKCDICENHISYTDFINAKAFDHLICSSADCKRVFDQKSQMTAFQFESYLSFQKTHIKKLRKEERNRKKYVERIVTYEKDQHQKAIKAVIDQNPQWSENEIRLVRLPSGLSEVTPISAERIEKYRAHLKTIITEALDNIERNIQVEDQNTQAAKTQLSMEQRVSERPELQIMADKLCEMCKGGCCPSGNDHAYLSATTIMQLIINRPELSVKEIEEIYLSKLGNVSIKHACINQTNLGCSLPRDMRSNICNSYYCPSVKSYLLDDTQTEIEDTNVIVVQWSNTNWNRLDTSFDNKVTHVALINDTETVPIS